MCEVEGCTKAGKRICSMHRMRMKRHGRYDTVLPTGPTGRDGTRIKYPTGASQSEKSAIYNRMRNYGLTEDRYQEMLAQQEWCCAICLQAFRSTKSTHVDHKHDCCPGVITCGECLRELLCPNCNHLLGSAHESIEILLAAVAYLREWGE